MVYIYYLGKVFSKSGKRDRYIKYYRTVYYVTSTGKKSQRDMVCYKKTGELKAKSRVWKNYVNENLVEEEVHKERNLEKALKEVAEDKEAKKAHRYWENKEKKQKKKEFKGTMQHQEIFDREPVADVPPAPKKKTK